MAAGTLAGTGFTQHGQHPAGLHRRRRERLTNAEVQAEVLRVLQNYQAVQLRRLREKPQSLSPSEMLVSIDDVSTRTNYDSVQVAVRLRATGPTCQCGPK